MSRLLSLWRLLAVVFVALPQLVKLVSLDMAVRVGGVVGTSNFGWFSYAPSRRYAYYQPLRTSSFLAVSWVEQIVQSGLPILLTAVALLVARRFRTRAVWIVATVLVVLGAASASFSTGWTGAPPVVTLLSVLPSVIVLPCYVLAAIALVLAGRAETRRPSSSGADAEARPGNGEPGDG